MRNEVMSWQMEICHGKWKRNEKLTWETEKKQKVNGISSQKRKKPSEK